MQVWSLGWEDPLDEGKKTHSNIRAWRIPWTEEPGRSQSTGSQKVRLDWSDLAHMYGVLGFAMQQWEMTIILDISAIITSSLLSLPAHSHPTLWVITEHQARFHVWYSSFLIAIYFTYYSVYISMLLSQFVLPSPFPTVSTSLSTSLLLPCK